MPSPIERLRKPPLDESDVDQFVWKKWFDAVYLQVYNEVNPNDVVSINKTLSLGFFFPVDATSGTITITLPASSRAKSKKYFIKKIDATTHPVVVTCDGSDLIDGASTFSIVSQWDAIFIESNGTGSWYVLGYVSGVPSPPSTGTSSVYNDILWWMSRQGYNNPPQDLISSVTNSDASLTISPTTGAVIASLNTGHANTWSSQQSFSASTSIVATGNVGIGTSSLVSGFRLTVTQDNAWPSDVTAGQLVLNGATTTGKRLVLGYDTTNNGGFIAAGNLGVAWTTLQLQPSGGFVSIGRGTTAGTAQLHIAASSTAASTAPIKLTSGTLMTTAEVGAIEFLTDKFYATITTGAARKEFAIWDAAGTSGRIPFETTNGRLTDASTLTFDSTNVRLMTGTATTTAGNDFWVQKTTNGQVGGFIQNLSTGTAGYAQMSAYNSANGLGIYKYSTGFTTAGLIVADCGLIYNSTSLLNIINAAAAAIVLAQGGSAAANEIFRWDSSGNMQPADGKNIILNATTGMKIGTATTQKLGFWNATPVAQKTGYGTPTGNVNQGSFAAGSITLANLAAEVAQLVLDLKATGIIGA